MTTSGRAAVHVKAPGKINVFLKVGAIDDTGYHDVAIAYQAVSLCEDVRVTEAGTWPGVCSEFCGLDHWRMTFTVRAVPEDEFTAWVAELDWLAFDQRSVARVGRAGGNGRLS